MGFGFNPDRLDVLGKGAAYGSITVGTIAVELKVGASPLDGRQAVHMMAMDNAVYWGYDSSVTVSTGTRLYKGQFILLPIGDGVSVYLIANGAGKDVRIGELA